MNNTILQISLYAIQLTEDFQTNVRSFAGHPSLPNQHVARANIHNVIISLIDDERKGERLLEPDGTRLIMAELFSRAWKDFMVRRALQLKTQAVEFAPELLEGLKYTSSYLRSYRFPDNAYSLPAAYLLSVAVVRELQRKSDRKDMVEILKTDGGRTQIPLYQTYPPQAAPAVS